MKKITTKLFLLLAMISLGTISYSQTCTASFSYSHMPNGVVNFYSTSTPVNSITTQYYWNFGNSTSYTATGNPSATTTYTANGSYTVTLFFLTPSTCSNMAQAVITITNVSTSTCNINANFNYNQGSNGLVNFNNTSTGTVTGVTYTWNFGDNSAPSNATSPAHTYSANGTYIATLTANNNLSVTCVSTKTMAINVNSYCTLSAGFNFSVNGGSVQFYNTTTPSVAVGYSWNFGNGGTSGSMNPSTTYTANGNYVVTLTATTNSACSSVISQTITITNASTCNINANFGFSQGSNGQVNFNNTSTGTNGSTTYSWTFGDSNNDTIPSPSHTYASNGSYVVTLIASNGGTCTSIKSVTITVNSICNLSASFSFTQGANGQVSFASTSTGTMSGYFYTWAFGDNTNGSGATTTHTYANGTYVVTLTVKNMSIAATCSSTATQTIAVTSNTCVANAGFTVVPTSTAQYWNAIPTASQNVVNAIWSWGDGSFSNTLYTSHQYSAAGTYDLCLSVTVACGASATYCFPYYIFRSSGNSDVIYINVIDPSSTVGLNEGIKAQSFGVYPNPGKGQFIVALSEKRTGEYRLDVLNLIGQKVHSVSASGSGGRISVDAMHLPEGVYLLDVYENGSRVGIQKIVIDR
jgi:PKD repeat protein